MSVTAPSGFRAAGINAGIKPGCSSDLALVVNDGPDDTAAGVFTTNKVKAAPVLWSQQVARQRRLRAVVLNSGGANACTGPEGFQDTHATAEKLADALRVGAIEVAVCSTGLIGQRLPLQAVMSGVDKATSCLAATREAATNAATAIMTTDTKPKEARFAHGDGWSVGGMAKGAGMLAPNMATMLGVLTTDAVVSQNNVDDLLRSCTTRTFDRLDVDGGTSTNDTVLLLASGASGITPTTDELAQVLHVVGSDLTHQLRADAEGATKLVDITVRGASSEHDAVTIGKVIAEDNLVKTALFGSDPNWGRIAMALGRARAEVDVERAEILVNGVLLFSGGVPARDRSEVDLTTPDVEIIVDLRIGTHEVTILSTDLSHGYVEENSAYSS